ncbi:invasin domain protein, partial [Yersinia pestis PY-76]
MCPENPQLGWGFSKAFSFGSVIKTPFDLLKQFAVWQLQMFNKKSKGGPNEGLKELTHTRWNCKYHIVFVTNGAIVIHTQRLKSDPGGNL